MSEIKVNSIKGVAASVAALSINNTDGTCTANLTNRNNRNLVINGAMNVAQRGTSSTTNGYGSVDRYAVYSQGTDEAPTHAQVDVASGTTPYTLGFRKAIKVTNGNQTSGAGAGDLVAIDYSIEAQDLANSGWLFTSASSFITLSFWIKSSVAQNFYVMLRSEDGTQRAYVIETGSLSADTWTKVTKTIPGNTSPTVQIDNNTGRGMLIEFVAFRGTNGTGSVTLNQWATYSSSARVPNMTSTWYTTNDATLEITGVQLEVSDHASEFEHLPYAVEERLCQRYYYRQSAEHQYMRYDCNGQCPSANGAQYVFSLPVRMRANPTIGYSALGDFYIYASNLQAKTPTAITLSAGSTKSPMLSFDKSSTFTAGAAAHLSTPNTQQGYIEFKAEL